jgi:hypothetical protein
MGVGYLSENGITHIGAANGRKVNENIDKGSL